jgi:hypothetical protein
MEATRQSAPLQLQTVYTPRTAWARTGGIRAHLRFWDSGLAAATGGRLGAQYVASIQTPADDDHGWHFHDVEWQAFYLLSGRMRHETEAYGELTLRAGDAGVYPGFLRHREWDFAPGSEMLALRSPAVTVTTTGYEAPLPAGVRERAPVYSSAGFVPAGAGFEARALGSLAAPPSRVGLRVIRAFAPGSATPWDPAASTWLCGLSGRAEVVVGRTTCSLGRLDALALAPGERTELVACSAGFEALELSLGPGQAAK